MPQMHTDPHEKKRFAQGPLFSDKTRRFDRCTEADEQVEEADKQACETTGRRLTVSVC